MSSGRRALVIKEQLFRLATTKDRTLLETVKRSLPLVTAKRSTRRHVIKRLQEGHEERILSKLRAVNQQTRVVAKKSRGLARGEFAGR